MSDIKKAAYLKGLAATEEELALINKLTLRQLTAEEVYVFRLEASNSEVDREWERFSPDTLEGFAKLFPGRPMLVDHRWSADKQMARIYAAHTEAYTKDGESHKRLILRAYLLRNEQSRPVIDAIEGGILRECSVGVAVEKAICSICGADKARTWCEHRPGHAYDGKTCVVTLEGARDVYECSFVPVPANAAAGITKDYGGEENKPAPAATGEDPETEKALALLELEHKRFLN